MRSHDHSLVMCKLIYLLEIAKPYLERAKNDENVGLSTFLLGVDHLRRLLLYCMIGKLSS